MIRSSMRWIPAAVVFATALSLANACTTHGVGGRCDLRNVPAGSTQNADCDTGLVCISGAELQLPDGGGSPQGYFCCPPPGSTITVDPSNICYTSNTTISDDAAIPTDSGGTSDTGTTDAATDSSSQDSSSDATADDSGDDSGDAASE